MVDLKGWDQVKTVSDLGEARVLELILESLDKDPEEVLGQGDDAVAFRMADGELLLVHTNLLVGSTDVPPGMSPFLAGRKAAIMNVSDVVSKGAEPLTLLFSLGFPGGYRANEVKEVARGLNSGARECGTYVTGGDIGEAGELILAGVALGKVEKDKLIRRRGARPGDVVAVTGPFGLTGLGFKILLEGLEAPPHVRGKALLAVYEPKARVKEALALAEARSVTAGMDSSDGLARSLHWLSRMSKVGFIISDLPVPKEVSEFSALHGIDPSRLALYEGGEEYELVLCVKPERWRGAVKAVRRVGGSLYKIGVATEEKRIVIRAQGRAEEEVEDLGWEHFLRKRPSR